MALQVHDISKAFGTVQANDRVSLTVEPGSLHAVLGENGAGKSTLMKILSGFQDADGGEVSLDGMPLRLGSPRAAIGAGIGMLHQDPLVALPFSVLDNFLFGRSGKIDRAAARAELAETSRRLGFSLDPEAVTRTLSVGERQQLEIVRLLSLGVRVLILDEPTSGITTGQREALFTALRRLAADGLIVLFVSHKLEEVEDLCHRVTVMRRGEVVGAEELPCPPSRLVSLMFGKEVTLSGVGRHHVGDVIVRLNGVTSVTGRRRIEGVDLELRAGEVFGLAGLAGSGQRALMRALAGLDRVVAGRIELAGEDVTGRPYRDLRRQGVHYLPAGRLEEGLFPDLTITEHLVLARPGSGVIDWRGERADALEVIEDFHIVGTPETSVEDLSGGNQQRLLLAMMPANLKVLLMEEPTRGLDIESADSIWRRIQARSDEGTTVVFASADLDELIRNCDRVAVCFDGRILRVVDAGDVDAQRLGSLIGGRGET